MPNRTKENYAVVIGSLKDTTYYNFHLESQVKALFTLVDLLLYSNPPNGIIFIVNMKGVYSKFYIFGNIIFNGIYFFSGRAYAFNTT